MKFKKDLTFLTLQNSTYDTILRHFRLAQEAEREHILIGVGSYGILSLKSLCLELTDLHRVECSDFQNCRLCISKHF